MLNIEYRNPFAISDNITSAWCSKGSPGSFQYILLHWFYSRLTELGRCKGSDWRRSLQDRDSALLYFTPIIRFRSWRPSSKLCSLWAKRKWLTQNFIACNEKNKYHYCMWNYERKICLYIFSHLKRMKYRISCKTVSSLCFVWWDAVVFSITTRWR